MAAAMAGSAWAKHREQIPTCISGHGHSHCSCKIWPQPRPNHGENEGHNDMRTPEELWSTAAAMAGSATAKAHLTVAKEGLNHKAPKAPKAPKGSKARKASKSPKAQGARTGELNGLDKNLGLWESTVRNSCLNL